MRTAVACVLLLAAAAGAGIALAREPEGASKVQAQSLLAEALAGEPGKEVIVQSYTFAPGAVLPWHIHPDAHEIAYVIEGDFTLKEINVLARSSVRCAEDNYTRDDEMLVFLEPVDSLFHTVNYQYGQFPIVGEIVKGWRDKANKPIDKPYAEVRREIQACVTAAHTPKPEGEPPPQPAKPVKPPEPRPR